MTDENNTAPESSLGDDIRELGKSLGDFFKSAWESEERKEIEEDLTGALNEVADTFRQLADDISNGEIGQQIRAEYEDLKVRVNSGEFKQKAQSELSKAIQNIKDELDKITDNWTPASPPPDEQESPEA